MKKADIDLYTDYLLSTFGQATATGLSAMLEGEISHDKVTRFLSEQSYTSKDLWKHVKSVVRSIESNEGVLIFDDTIQEKSWTDENELICWHFDHCSGKAVKGINLFNALYHNNDVSIPVAFELITKPIQYTDPKTKQIKRKSEKTKNEMMREMIDVCIHNTLKFRFILMDTWFASEENFDFITRKKKDFIATLKSNRLVALSLEEKEKKCYRRIEEVDFPENAVMQGWLKGYEKQFY
jgi:SRSO17 transposase